MKLNFFHNQNKLANDNVLFEEDSSSDDIERPIGISKEDWTPEFIEHLKDIRSRNPKLYHKIKKGH